MPSSGITPTNTFANQTGPIPLSQLDTNFTQDANALNSISTYGNYFLDSSGTPNTITVTIPSPLIFSYVAGIPLQVKLSNTNTSTAVNINVNGLGNQLILNNDGTAPAIGSLVSGMILNIQHDGTRFKLISQSGTIPVGLFGDGTVGSPSISFSLDQDTGLYRIGSNNLAAATGGILAWQVDSSQRFLLSSQPSFEARRTTNQNLPSATVTTLIFDTIASQQGGTNYASGTGIFTAPVAGLYIFPVSILMDNVSGGNAIINSVYISKNNAASGTSGRYFLSLPTASDATGFTLTTGNTVTMTAVVGPISLIASDTIRIKSDLGGTNAIQNAPGGYFGGYLLG